jgi:hypothetical protein
MKALANRRFLKMNGLGNEIVVVDLRGTQARISPTSQGGGSPPDSASTS